MTRTLGFLALACIAGSPARGEEVYLLQIEHIGYEVHAEKRPEQHHVIGSITLAIEADKRFQVKSSQQGAAMKAEGRLRRTENGLFALEIAYATKTATGRLEVETRISVTLKEPQEIGAIRGTREISGKRQAYTEAVRITLTEHEAASGTVAPNAGAPKTVTLPARPRWIEPSSVDKGMMFDAIEHRLRIQKRIRDQRQLPTTIEREEFRPSPELRKLFPTPMRD